MAQRSRQRRPVVIGITGGIGSGKSTVAGMLARQGAEVIDADALGHALLERADVRGAIRRAWGAGVFDASGGIDRKALAAAAFASDEQTRRLNAIVHPPLLAQLRRRLDDCRAEAAVIDAALLTEWGLDELCDVVVFVHAPQATRIERVSERGWTAQEFREREARQHSLDQKRKRSQYTIENDGTPSATLRMVVQFWDENVKQFIE